MTEATPVPDETEPVQRAVFPAGTADDTADDTAPGEPTGVTAADEGRERLGGVAAAPLEEHVEIFEDVHRRLQEGLADLDEG